jgi:MHS family proline/betaine transporter-like MFS transporter
MSFDPSGLSVSYSLAVAIFGGFAPLINASLIDLLGSKVAASYYLTIATIISLVALASAHRLGIR